MKTILAGDIGGTKTRLAIFRFKKEHLHIHKEKIYFSEKYPGIEPILKDFLREGTEVDIACLGVAAPITGNYVRLTNLPWTIHISSLQKRFSIKRLEIINDLLANAYGIFLLKKRDFEILNPGIRRKGNEALLSAGTGLGEAILFWDGTRHLPSPSEGGHVEFGPRNRLEIDLLKFLSKRYGHVSYERILSGTGLFHIYQFLKASKRFGHEPHWLKEMMEQIDPPVVISELARLKKNRLCERALDLFVSIYGAAAGNVALHVMALGGIFLGGGIAPKIFWKLKDGSFMKAFKDKGRYSDLMAQIPVKVIMNERTSLLGAALKAREMLKAS
ncbi:MAG: glucokinase [Thermodesulfobacteriota bacterium]